MLPIPSSVIRPSLTIVPSIRPARALRMPMAPSFRIAPGAVVVRVLPVVSPARSTPVPDNVASETNRNRVTLPAAFSR